MCVHIPTCPCVAGKKRSQADVQKLCQSLHIQVDNLCCLLAQERVVNFSKLKPDELLIETEKAISPEYVLALFNSP